ncbi:MAG TPA: methyltransferase domain-containing protein [Pyrinomonadaceae bacterium]|nr:methyltransferase domain-containing protein [Pyrinomonadaceae bacterium]
MADWDERYRRGEHVIKEPLPLLVRLANELPPGRALDLACGAGRHATFLAERGWRVTAVDASPVGIELAKASAREREVEVDWRVADLERGGFEIEPGAYDLIGVFYYLQRSLFPQIRAGVRRGGIVVAAIHMVDESPDVKPMNPDFLLRPGELRAEFRGWEILHDYEGAPTEEGHRRRSAEIVVKKVMSTEYCF